MSKININKEYEENLKELKTLLNMDFKEGLETLAKVANANIERYGEAKIYLAIAKN